MNSCFDPNNYAGTHYGSNETFQTLVREGLRGVRSYDLTNEGRRKEIIDFMTLDTYDVSMATADKVAKMDKKLDKITKALKIDTQA